MGVDKVMQVVRPVVVSSRQRAASGGLPEHAAERE
jgi:hypothetical protein